MPVELRVPSVGESITEVELGDWLKSEGESLQQDEPVVVIETEKVTVDLPAPVTGTLTRILKRKGEKAAVGEVIGSMEPGGKSEPPAKQKAPPPQPETKTKTPSQRAQSPEPQPEPRPPDAPAPSGVAQPEAAIPDSGERGERLERVVPMTPIRRRIAERLVEAQRVAALLTTFNEIEMTAVLALRKEYQETFQRKHETKLGFMSFFVRASVEALKFVPQMNAEVRGHDLVFRDYCDIGIAIGSGKGLVVPILRNAERLGLADIERKIADFARRVEQNALKVDELQGGTFTISNGGVYGSLLSTPIVNPPQSGVLGMHAIEDRPVARSGQVVIRPMMYVALTYDHRVVDGREAVTFLKRIKELVEDPARMLLDV
jgi:2-oxoglutarate dehydrogenase E2 component (dihydrolipoamide succinyltransferase)